MRRSDVALTEQLREEPFRFSFFQAVRLMEWLGSETGRAAVGHDGPPHMEAVRFISRLSLSFPPSEIFSLEDAPKIEGDVDTRPPRMATPFMGLVGAGGALPTVYTETLIAMRSRRSEVPLDFLNMFHHRLVSLFYRAWEKFNVPALWERGGPGTGRLGNDPFTKHLFDLIGLGLEPLRNRQNVTDESLLFYAGFFAQQHRPVVSLELLLRDYFGCPASVLTFHGQWLFLEPDQCSRLGRRGAYNALGVDALAGQRVWDDQSKFRVRIGPLGFDEFRSFLPGGARSQELVDLVRFYATMELAFDIQLVLKAEDVPFCRASCDPNGAAQLGRTSWLKRREFGHDAEDAVFRPRAAAVTR